MLAAQTATSQDEAQTKEAPTPSIEEAVEAGVALLLHNQERYSADRPVGRLPDDKLKDWQEGELERLEKIRKRTQKSKRKASEWPYEGVYRVRGGRIPTGYRVGGTAITCLALLHAPGFDSDAKRQAAVQRGVEFVLDRLENDESMQGVRPFNYDVRGWGQTYGLHLMLTTLEMKAVDAKTLKNCKRMIPKTIEAIAMGTTDDGAWNYAGSRREGQTGKCSPFMTGPTLLTLYWAKDAGYEVPQELIANALLALQAARNSETGSYAYSGKRKSVMPASAGRSAAAELALFQAGLSSESALLVAVDGFFDNWDHLFDRKSKQGTHEGPYNIAPYYFFFAHTYAAFAIEKLPENLRVEYRTKLQEIMWRTRESNGGWNDRIFPRTESYSTAMSILALLAPGLPSHSTWKDTTGKLSPVSDDKKDGETF